MRIGIISLLFVIILVLVSESAGRPKRNKKNRDLGRGSATIRENRNGNRRGFRHLSGHRRNRKAKARKSNSRGRPNRKLNRRGRKKTSSGGITTIAPENSTFKQRIQSDPPNAICSFCRQNMLEEARNQCVKAFCSFTRDNTAGNITRTDSI
ncbi:uncharacterized protein LOC125681544 [Ostrea edulis]|uniref:uncharacterized protein LOC125681544 n=1 Tax=Ostrea edulis TaxID=37623 RepID=UPI0024AED5EB|nr:uncharacterized protein LOC125681544 [Ostrea edulis]